MHPCVLGDLKTRAGGSFVQIARHLFGEITLWLGQTTKPSVWAELLS